MDLRKKLGKRIQQLRKLNKFSQELFAEKIGMSRNSLSEIETGESYPKPENLECIKTALNVEFKDLFTFGNKTSDKLDNISMKLKKVDDKTLDFVNAILDTYIKDYN